jgi:hypothetical protein
MAGKSEDSPMAYQNRKVFRKSWIKVKNIYEDISGIFRNKSRRNRP